MFKVGIITASDKGSRGDREDLSGALIRDIMENRGYQVVSYRILPDEKDLLAQEMIRLSDEVMVDLVLTTGGTGFSMRDVTPEATISVCDRMAPGISEAIRGLSLQITSRAMLSRAVSGIRKSSLIINLPGSPKAVKESLDFIMDSVHHGLEIMTGRDGECARSGD
jgi:molybdenum cofactor synthesis domain-containing protein